MEKQKYDISRNIELRNSFHGLKNTDKQYRFYYDETNNIRKFWFKKEYKLNVTISDLNKNFVLGGIVHNKEVTNFQFKELKEQLNLDSKIIDMKFKHIAKSDYLSCLKSKKLEFFLGWLIKNDLYIHYSSLDILYWSLIDILESMIPYEYLEIGNELKTVLYELFKIDLESSLSILYEYDYPNIKRNRANQFLDSILNLINSKRFELINKFPLIRIELIDIVYRIIENSKGKELTFIMDEKDYILIEDLFNFYLRPLKIFKNSFHIFDEENTIQNIFNKFELYDKDKKLDLYKFSDSKDKYFIQISDVIIGLIGKLFEYINNLKFKDINNIKDCLNERQKNNFSMIATLILKSEKENMAFIHSIQSLVDREKLFMILQKFS